MVNASEIVANSGPCKNLFLHVDSSIVRIYVGMDFWLGLRSCEFDFEVLISHLCAISRMITSFRVMMAYHAVEEGGQIQKFIKMWAPAWHARLILLYFP